jgi:hypothetical protein
MWYGPEGVLDRVLDLVTSAPAPDPPNPSIAEGSIGGKRTRGEEEGDKKRARHE